MEDLNTHLRSICWKLKVGGNRCVITQYEREEIEKKGKILLKIVKELDEFLDKTLMDELDICPVHDTYECWCELCEACGNLVNCVGNESVMGCEICDKRICDDCRNDNADFCCCQEHNEIFQERHELLQERNELLQERNKLLQERNELRKVCEHEECRSDLCQYEQPCEICGRILDKNTHIYCLENIMGDELDICCDCWGEDLYMAGWRDANE